MMHIVTLRTPIAFAVASSLLLLISSCKHAKDEAVAPVEHQLANSSTVADLVKIGSEAALSGDESCSFLTSSGKRIRLEFPLMDNNKKHWQYKALQELDDKQAELEEQSTSEATVLFARRNQTTWTVGTKEISEVGLEKRMKTLAADKLKTVLVIQVEEAIPVTCIETIWLFAHKIGTRVILQTDQSKSND